MPYSDLVRQESEYTYSANIQFDIENDRKLLRFIPNETTAALLKDYFTDITRQNPHHHSRILYGSYGTGKSHFLTVLSLLLSKTYTNGVAFGLFIDRLARLDKGLAADITAFVNDEEKKPFLVVPIVFDFDDFNRCIYYSLKKKLEALEIPVNFRTFYDQAAQLLNQWKATPESMTRLTEACRTAGVRLSKLEEQLTKYDARAEAKFQKLFSEMTYGVKYVYEVSNLSDAINQANAAISSNYAGIVFVFDEFGRYIEDNIKRIKVKNVQDLAEICDHTEGNNHVILVSHKEISQYTQKYGKNISNEWKKVEGRFKATPINDKQDQCLSLISNILTLDPDLWQIFSERFRGELNNMYSEASSFRALQAPLNHEENPYIGGFPLHPISLFALDKLSKKVAQNERTFFTFLASKEEKSLFEFLENHELDEFHFVGIDDIFDYFETSIKSVQSDSSYEWYRNLQHALSKANENEASHTAAARILKVVAAIGIINDSSALVADKGTITSVIDLPKDTLENALSELCAKKILKYSGAYKRYDFFEASIFDVEELIKDGSGRVQDKAIIDTLNECFVDFVLYPYQYNRLYKINRVFLPVFCIPEELSRRSFSSRFGQYYDGILAIVLPDSNSDNEQLAADSAFLERTIVIAHPDSDTLKNAVKQFIAIQYLESKKDEYNSKDPAFEKELGFFKDEVTAVIKETVRMWNAGLDDEATVFAQGLQRKGITSFTELSNLASQLLNESYNLTLIVNNELINKNAVSGSIMSAKKNVLNGILAGRTPESYYGVQDLSPDYIAIRSVLVKNGYITVPEENVVQNSLPNNTKPQTEVKAVLEKYVGLAKSGSVGFASLYHELKMPPYGLRDGYLSILFAHFLIPYKRTLVVVSHAVEQELSAELFEEIVRRPNDYAFTIASWSKEQLDYFDSLTQVFSDYINSSNLSKNKVKTIYDAMLLHYKNISKFARTTHRFVSAEAEDYRRSISKATTNYSEFLLTEFGKIGGSLDGSIDTIKNVKLELESVLQKVAGEIATQVAITFGFSKTSSLGQALSERYSEEWSAKRKKSFDYYTNAFLEIAGAVTPDDSDYQITLRLAKAITGLELTYWNDSHFEELIERLSAIKETLEAYTGDNILHGSEMRMTLVTSSGKEKSVVFDRSELGNLGRTVKNKINSTFGNYGLAISYDEKVQIVLSVLEDLLEGK